MKYYRKMFGDRGEEKAKLFLIKKGYRILDTNYRTPFGELDIVGIEGDTVAFIEVKTRRSSKYGSPLGAITYRKQNHLIKSALFYLGEKKYDFKNYRFDAVAIITADKSDNIEVFKNIFESDAKFSF